MRLSPDNQWIAYDIDESGRSEVYVLSFPDGRGKTQISTNGGIGPKWVRGGKEIIYQDFDGQVMSVEVDTSHGGSGGHAEASLPAARRAPTSAGTSRPTASASS